MAPSAIVASLKEEEKVVYFTKLKQLGFFHEEDDPFLVEERGSEDYSEQWSSSVELWPQVEFGNVYVYLVDCPGYTHQSLKDYKSLDAYNYFVNGWVHQLYVRQSHTGHTIVKGTVNRSQDISDESCKAWVGFSHVDGSIVTGYCTCMAGDSSASICTHVAAIMFQVEAAPHIACANTNICLICPYHCGKQIIKLEEPQENVTSVTVVELMIKQNQPCDLGEGNIEVCEFADYQQDTNDFEVEMISDVTYSEDHNMTISSQVEPELEKPVFEKVASSQTSYTDSDDLLLKKDLDDVYLCSQCDLAFTDVHYLEDHTKRQHRKKTDVPSCNVCIKTFKTNSGLKRHMKIHRNEENSNPSGDDGKPSNPTVEGCVTKNTMTSEETLPTVEESGLLFCKICFMAFSFDHLLEGHMARQHNEEYVKLKKGEIRLSSFNDKQTSTEDDKPESFAEDDKLECCTENAEPSNKKSFKCTICGQVFPSSFKLGIHTRIHTGERLCTFKECGKSFVNSSGLRRHSSLHTADRPFKCSMCGQNFRTKYSLQIHVNKCNGANLFLQDCDASRLRTAKDPQRKQPSHVCSVCEKVFKRRYDLKVHMRKHTGGKPFKCNECSKVFNKINNLHEHILRTHRNIKPHKCEICEKGFVKKTELIRHERTHTGEKPFKCNECEKTFADEAGRKRHIERHHLGGKSYMCHECGKGFFSSSNLNIHMRSHTGEKPFICNKCDKTFSYKANLDRHVKIHTGEKQFICHDCGWRFHQKNALQAHIRRHTGEKPFKCNKCGQAFKMKPSLVLHIQKHGAENHENPENLKYKKLFNCKECGNSFNSFCGLQCHMRIHVRYNSFASGGNDSTMKPYICSLCGKSFSSLLSRNNHLKLHTKERKFKCEQCDKSFLGKPALEQHKRIHTGEKPLVCSTCGMNFAFQANLQRHMRRHTGEKPFKCHICNRLFSQSSNLHSHMKTHTGEKPHKCETCGKAFTEKRSLTRHVRKHGEISLMS